MYDKSKVETKLNIFHPLSNESINASHEYLNRIRAGDTKTNHRGNGNVALPYQDGLQLAMLGDSLVHARGLTHSRTVSETEGIIYAPPTPRASIIHSISGSADLRSEQHA